MLSRIKESFSAVGRHNAVCGHRQNRKFLFDTTIPTQAQFGIIDLTGAMVWYILVLLATGLVFDNLVLRFRISFCSYSCLYFAFITKLPVANYKTCFQSFITCKVSLRSFVYGMICIILCKRLVYLQMAGNGILLRFSQ